MPSDAVIAALRDILINIDIAARFVGDADFVSFRDDLRTVYAVTRCLEIISEASRRLPDDLKARHPSIAWRNVAGAGNIYRHDYEQVDPAQLWDTIRLALPPLREVIEQELANGPA